MTVKIAVFASGSGSNFQAFVDAVKAGRLDAELSLLVCDRPGARVTRRAEENGIPVFSFSSKDYESKMHFEREILSELEQRNVDWIVLAGYMRLIGVTLLSRHEGRIVNIHPSLLPAFPGKDAIGQALSAGVKVSGVTVHYVDEGMDTGKIIAQEAVPVLEDDNHERLQQRIHGVEHELYPRVMQELIEKG
ncbi:MAG TPA: phosphoribosylglycinamide formyltransferase [Bacillales bacterium]|nr:phosphoribosylglycinamide formyltransferase [Bacillales bacterium]